MGPAKTLVWHLVFGFAKINNNVICLQIFFKIQDTFQDSQGKTYRFSFAASSWSPFGRNDNGTEFLLKGGEMWRLNLQQKNGH